MPHVMRGKHVGDWVARTFCNYGEPQRTTEVGKHYSHETALRQGKRIAKTYRGYGPRWRAYHIWTVDREGKLLFSTLRESGANISLTGGLLVDWEEDPLFSSTAWMASVAEGQTRLGYRDWCNMKACVEQGHTDGGRDDY